MCVVRTLRGAAQLLDAFFQDEVAADWRRPSLPARPNRPSGGCKRLFHAELDVRWIDTKSNLIADTLSRKFDRDHNPALYVKVVRDYLSGPASDPRWLSWPVQRPARPELLAHIPVASPADFSSSWGSLDRSQMTRIIPFYLQAVAAGRDTSNAGVALP